MICGKENNIKNYQNETIKDINFGTLNLFLNSFANLNIEKYLNDSLKNNMSNNKPVSQIEGLQSQHE